MKNIPKVQPTAEEDREMFIRQLINEYVMNRNTVMQMSFYKEHADETKGNGIRKYPLIKQKTLNKAIESLDDSRQKLINIGLSDDDIEKLAEESDAKWKREITDDMHAFGTYEQHKVGTVMTSGQKAAGKTGYTQKAVREKQTENVSVRKEVTSGEYSVDGVYTPMVSDIALPQIHKDEVEYGNWDMIDLPSKGQCYPCKRPSVAVSQMTASDENLITSPNLYKDGMLIDALLKKKVVDENFDGEDLCAGDADAVTLWLRATGYGNEFPIDITDPESGEMFSAVIDLSTIKEKPFNLVGDENGWFDYTTEPRRDGTFDTIKFKFLTRREERMLQKMEAYDNKSTQKLVILANLKEISAILRSDREIDGMESDERKDIIDRLHDWIVNDSKEITTEYSHVITNRMAMQIQSINGNTDREYIRSYVASMPSKDALGFRKYVLANEPGMDFKLIINRPESLGGGSFETFLNWDDTIFFHIS